MTEALDQANQPTTSTDDLLATTLRIIQASEEPLTPSKIRTKLPTKLRSDASLEDALQRQVAAQVLQLYPKYRSQQDRYWDRPMPVHVAKLLQQLLENGPLAWKDIKRKLPGYALPTAEDVLNEQVNQAKVFRHPKMGRGGERFGIQPADPKDYLRTELDEVFRRLEKLGFSKDCVRPAAIELLHDEEWAPAGEDAGVTAGNVKPAMDAGLPPSSAGDDEEESVSASSAAPSSAGDDEEENVSASSADPQD